MAEVSAHKNEIAERGAQIAIVHMGDKAAGAAMAEHYDLGGAEFVSDPEKTLYKAFELKKGGLNALLGPKNFIRGFKAAILDGHGFGKPVGDPMQMGGAFLVSEGKIVRSFVHKTASDRPDYVALASAAA